MIMGRYYHGDIEGKFWFGVQPSDDPKFFGAQEEEPEFISYYTEDLEGVAFGIDICKKELGKYYKDVHHFYTNIVSDPNYAQQLHEWLNISESEADNLIGWYARLELGEKMYNQVKEHGSCAIEAEI
tara:strand:+ start:1032 stop:1412 length:381 start_codon:yes stop_codon:yes gene_type:complete